MTMVNVEMQRETKVEVTKESIFISNRISVHITNSKTIGLKTVNIQKVFTEYIIFLKTNKALFFGNLKPTHLQKSQLSFLFSMWSCTSHVLLSFSPRVSLLLQRMPQAISLHMVYFFIFILSLIVFSYLSPLDFDNTHFMYSFSGDP